jgi:hypothetical protein
VFAPAYALPDAGRSVSPGKTVIVHEGEEVDDLDLSIKRGGVIAGRVIDSNGQPVIGERVSVQVVDEANRKRRVILHNQSGETDDRGIYRLYGLAEGRYIVSISRRPRPGSMMGGRGGNAPTTFYPGVADESNAQLVEVHAGDETENVDILLGRAADTYNVAGRVIDAETGRPVPNIACGYTELTGNRLPGFNVACKTDANGAFKLNHVAPGRYAFFLSSDSDNDFYSEQTLFEISSGDVQGLEIKARRGSTISGVAVVQGVKDPTVLSRLSELAIYLTQPDKSSPNPVARAPITSDGSFNLTGVPPGKVSFLIISYPKQDFTLLHVEQNGVEQAKGIDVPAGESVSGIRLVLTYGKGSVKGRIKIENWTLPEGSRSSISVAPAGMPGQSIRFVEPDSQGRFIITDLPVGDYELTVRVTMPQIPGVKQRRPLSSVKQPVTVKSGVDTEVTIVLDLAQTR